MTPKEAIEGHKLSVKSEFVPFSQSRNAKPNAKVHERSLNWRVTLCQDGRDILTTDYSAGIAHCPSHSHTFAARMTTDEAERIEFETEQGKQANGFRKAILPDELDVIVSLLLESVVIDYSCFEEWASSFGYDPDSRKAEKIYNDCLRIALCLRNGLGETVLDELKEAFRDY